MKETIFTTEKTEAKDVKLTETAPEPDKVATEPETPNFIAGLAMTDQADATSRLEIKSEINRQQNRFSELRNQRNAEIAQRRSGEDVEVTTRKEVLRAFFTGTYYRIAEEYVLRSRLEEAREEREAQIEGREGDNLYREEALADISRIIDQSVDVIREDEGEARANITDTNTEITDRASEIIKNYAREMSRENITPEERMEIERSFEEERMNLLDDLKDNREIFFDNNAVIDNLKGVAENLIGFLRHGGAMKKFDENFKLIVGDVRSGLKTEAHHNRIDRGVQYLQQNRVAAAILSPTAFSIAAGAAYSISSLGSSKIASSSFNFIAPALAPAVVGAAISSFAKNKEIKSDLALHISEVATGRSIRESSPRREQFDQFRMAERALQASQTTERINQILNSDEITDADLQNLQELYFSTEATLNFSSRNNFDLVTYSHINVIQRERTDLLFALAKASQYIESATENGRIDLGDNNFDEYRAELIASQTNLLEEAYSQNQEGFNSFKRQEIIRAAGRGAIIGLGVGIVMHEIIGRLGIPERISGASDNGVSQIKSTTGETVMNYLNDRDHRMNPNSWHDISIGDNDSITLPEGVSLQDNGSDFSLLNEKDGTTILSGISIKDGEIAKESLKALNDQGVEVNHTQHTIFKEESKIITITNKDAILNEEGPFERITRDKWGDNKTPAPEFDKNELKLHWGGENGSGIDAKGNYVYSLAKMTSDGSFNHNLSADIIKELKAGKVYVNLSLSQGTQMHVISVPVNEHFQAVISPDSEAVKMGMFSSKDGQAVFNGRFAEASILTGENNGIKSFWVAATDEGAGIDNVSKEITEKIPMEVNKYVFTPTRDEIIVPPPVVFIHQKRPIETTAEAKMPPKKLNKEEKPEVTPVKEISDTPVVTPTKETVTGATRVGGEIDDGIHQPPDKETDEEIPVQILTNNPTPREDNKGNENTTEIPIVTPPEIEPKEVEVPTIDTNPIIPFWPERKKIIPNEEIKKITSESYHKRISVYEDQVNEINSQLEKTKTSDDPNRQQLINEKFVLLSEIERLKQESDNVSVIKEKTMKPELSLEERAENTNDYLERTREYQRQLREMAQELQKDMLTDTPEREALLKEQAGLTDEIDRIKDELTPAIRQIINESSDTQLTSFFGSQLDAKGILRDKERLIEYATQVNEVDEEITQNQYNQFEMNVLREERQSVESAIAEANSRLQKRIESLFGTDFS